MTDARNAPEPSAVPPPPTPTGPLAWVRRHPYPALMVPLFVAMAFMVARQSPERSEWDSVYRRAAQAMLDGQDLYSASRKYTYPPVSAWLALPFAPLPWQLARAGWWAVNCVAVAVLLFGSRRLSGGRRLAGSVTADRAEHLAAVLALLCGARFAMNAVSQHQTDAVIAALLIGGCLLLQSGRSIAGAAFFGLAAAMKCTALLWGPYLLYRRRPAAAGVVFMVAVGANLLPDLTHPPPGGQARLVQWYEKFLEPLVSGERTLGAWYADPNDNHSLPGLVRRWTQTRPVFSEGSVRATIIDGADPGVTRTVTAAAGILLLLITAWAMGWNAPPPAAADEPGRAPRETLEYSAVLLLMVLLSPMSGKAHFGTMVLPAYCLGRAYFIAGDRAAGAFVLTATTCSLATLQMLPRVWVGTMLFLGLVTLTALLLLAGVLCQLRRAPAGADEPGAKESPRPGAPRA